MDQHCSNLRRAAQVAYTLFRRFSPEVIAATTAVAAGRTLAMLPDTIPKAFAEAHELAGLVTVLGFLVAFILAKVSCGHCAT
jgi:zinc transporter, ZIP family